MKPPRSDVEDVLRRALRPVDPPAGFADRVIRRARSTTTGPAPSRTGGSSLLRWATAAALVVGVSGALWYRAEEQRRAEGEAARRQVLQSLAIAGAKLQAVQMKINHQGESRQ